MCSSAKSAKEMAEVFHFFFTKPNRHVVLTNHCPRSIGNDRAAARNKTNRRGRAPLLKSTYTA